jgi:N6-adenosine-specific RNA methylase IME4
VKYHTIVADPPWRYRKDGIDPRSNGKAYSRNSWAEQNYLTLSNAAIRDLPVGQLAAESGHLYLWVTAPRLYGERHDDSITPHDIMRAWGFEYRTTLVWWKQPGLGLGSYWRVDTEFVLFGIRGSAPVAPHLRRSNVIVAPRGEHSQKPDAFYDMVEQVSSGPYVELFARRHRFFWDVWGNESANTAEMPT